MEESARRGWASGGAGGAGGAARPRSERRGALAAAEGFPGGPPVPDAWRGGWPPTSHRRRRQREVDEGADGFDLALVGPLFLPPSARLRPNRRCAAIPDARACRAPRLPGSLRLTSALLGTSRPSSAPRASPAPTHFPRPDTPPSTLPGSRGSPSVVTHVTPRGVCAEASKRAGRWRSPTHRRTEGTPQGGTRRPLRKTSSKSYQFG